MKRGEWADLATDGETLACRVIPGARQERLERQGRDLRIAVTAPAESGKATAAVQRALAHALGIAPSRLTLIRGATARDKLFRILPLPE